MEQISFIIRSGKIMKKDLVTSEETKCGVWTQGIELLHRESPVNGSYGLIFNLPIKLGPISTINSSR